MSKNPIPNTARNGQTDGPNWLVRVALLLAALLLLAGIGYGLKNLLGQPEAPKRQVVRIVLLPDAPPPPPPPPPKEEKRPDPPKTEKPLPLPEAPKTPEPPAPVNEPIKMEGPAGDGPSVFSSGAVNNEYRDGTPNTGLPGSGGAAAAVDRARDRLYANSARTLLRDALERALRSDAPQLTATFTLWVAADGEIRRFELEPTGEPRTDGELSAALDQTRRDLILPAPPSALQPMRFKITLQPAG